MMVMKNSKFYYWGLLAVWSVLCIYVLVSFLLHPSAQASGEVSLKFHLEMLILTFPLGYLAGLVVGLSFTLLAKVGLELPIIFGQYFNILITWVAMIIVGFLQWFVWSPKLWLWIKSKVKTK
jgi:hypothetical protein